MNGIIVLNKEANLTSREVVNKVCKILNTKKIGHTGTLDPFATGLLVLCIGKYTKLASIITNYEKEYVALIELGTLTDTLDITGSVIKKEYTHFTSSQIDKVLKEMTTTYLQEVPIYSAIHKDGKRLYELARNGINVKLPKREVTIKSLVRISDVTYHNGKTRFMIKTTVSKGTYIRSLARDIALKLKTIGIIISLNRTKLGDFKIEDSYTIEDIKNNNFKLVSDDKIFKDYFKVTVNQELETKIKNGAILPNIYKKLPVAFYNEQGKILALYKKYQEDKIKPFKTFY